MSRNFNNEPCEKCCTNRSRRRNTEGESERLAFADSTYNPNVICCPHHLHDSNLNDTRLQFTSIPQTPPPDQFHGIAQDPFYSNEPLSPISQTEPDYYDSDRGADTSFNAPYNTDQTSRRADINSRNSNNERCEKCCTKRSRRRNTEGESERLTFADSTYNPNVNCCSHHQHDSNLNDTRADVVQSTPITQTPPPDANNARCEKCCTKSARRRNTEDESERLAFAESYYNSNKTCCTHRLYDSNLNDTRAYVAQSTPIPQTPVPDPFNNIAQQDPFYSYEPLSPISQTEPDYYDSNRGADASFNTPCETDQTSRGADINSRNSNNERCTNCCTNRPRKRNTEDESEGLTFAERNVTCCPPSLIDTRAVEDFCSINQYVPILSDDSFLTEEPEKPIAAQSTPIPQTPPPDQFHSIPFYGNEPLSPISRTEPSSSGGTEYVTSTVSFEPNTDDMVQRNYTMPERSFPPFCSTPLPQAQYGVGIITSLPPKNVYQVTQYPTGETSQSPCAGTEPGLTKATHVIVGHASVEPLKVKSKTSSQKSKIPRKLSSLNGKKDSKTSSTDERTKLENTKQDSISMLSVVISTIMLLAAGVQKIPQNYINWTVRYLKCIRNMQGEYPANVKKFLRMLTSEEERDRELQNERKCKCPYTPRE